MLWLSLYFPHFALDVRRRAAPIDVESTAPTVVADETSAQARVQDCDAAARRRGVTVGMGLGAALALCQDLRIWPRDTAAENQALQGVAVWAQQFTPVVSIAGPDVVLLEVAGSLRLFGGAEALRARVLAGVQDLGYEAHAALAPTPAAAVLLARAAYPEPVLAAADLARVIRRLPVHWLPLASAVHQRLAGMGLRNVGDCMRLPRAGLAQRCGHELVQLLDRALGRAPDPRRPFFAPPRFRRALSFNSAVENTEALLFGTQRLLLELKGFLQARGSAVQRLQLQLLHQRVPATPLALNLVRPSRNPKHLLELWRERLARQPWSAPVEGIELRADELIPLAEDSNELFAQRSDEIEDSAQLLERLRARLGTAAVRGLDLVADHRPEHAWRARLPNAAPVCEVYGARPLWLLPAPRPVALVRGKLWLGGELTRLQGPERIESGWWDEAEQRRDYFIMRNDKQERFWVFRDARNPQQWFLHGVFA